MTKDEQGLLIDVACSCLSVDSVKEDSVFPFWKGKSKVHVLHEEAPRAGSVCWKCICGWEHTPGKCLVKGGYLGDVPSAGNAGEEHSDAGVATKAEWAVQLQSEN
ncbi:RING finger protein 183-like protein [Platysternon megacephalum]|uniref:RING finger protein 183-like protein n=1 Tax=Platysternon megacephalum TaxID=55544 RepID=A0A4D9DYT1_9SAUR|nr:RING finger protein 183-like protein [Platysternon megacephalum]